MKGELKSLIKGRVSFDVSMAKHTSLRVGGSADVLAFPRDEHDLREILRFARERAIPYYILGKGTNVIVRDGGLRGIVISLCRGFRRMTILGRRDQEVLISAEAGGNLKNLVRFTRERSLSGLEPFIGIPGTVGGALAMNAGAFGSEMGDVVRSIAVMGIDYPSGRNRANLVISKENLPGPWDTFAPLAHKGQAPNLQPHSTA